MNKVCNIYESQPNLAVAIINLSGHGMHALLFRRRASNCNYTLWPRRRRYGIKKKSQQNYDD